MADDITNQNVQAFAQAVQPQQPYAGMNVPRTAAEALAQAQAFDAQKKQAAMAAMPSGPVINPNYQKALGTLYGGAEAGGRKADLRTLYGPKFVDANGMPTQAGISAGLFPKGSPYVAAGQEAGQVGRGQQQEAPSFTYAPAPAAASGAALPPVEFSMAQQQGQPQQPAGSPQMPAGAPNIYFPSMQQQPMGGSPLGFGAAPQPNFNGYNAFDPRAANWNFFPQPQQ